MLKQTISETTSAKVREMCNLVVSGENGTGHTARPAGYMIGGKTGTAETLPRGNREYVVSFMGYAPADNPQIAIYVVVDRPNVPGSLMDDAKFATRIVRSILTEVLPYKGIFMTEELSDKEREELEALQIEIMTPPVTEQGQEPEGEEGTPEGENPDETTEEGAEGEEGEDVQTPAEPVWKSFPIDPETGYAVDPSTGAFVDPVTGAVLGGSFEGGMSAEPEASPSPSPGSTAVNRF